MKIFFHVGPHKTGTTTVQKALKAVYGSPAPGSSSIFHRLVGRSGREIWYPSRDAWLGTARAGHGGLADPFNKRRLSYDPKRGGEELKEVVDVARRAGVVKLLISSEDFAFATDEGIESIRLAMGDSPVRLIFSATPFKRRFVSLWSASVIFGNTRSIEKSVYLLETAPTFSTGLYRRFLDGIAPDSAAIVIANPESPGQDLLADFFSACGLEWRECFEAKVSGLKLNPSVGANEARMISLFNEIYRESIEEIPEKSGRKAAFAHPEYLNARLALQRLFARKEWTSAVAPRKTEFPESLVETVRERALSIVEEINGLSREGRLEVLGDPVSLLAGFQPQSPSD
jgi:hypothetical protein